MYRVRMHGRGGQGIKTASRILGSALFASGFEVQDAPRYGAERRGAPLYATVRAARAPIRERGAVESPDLVVVADETLLGVGTAGVLKGVDAHTTLLIASDTAADTWRERLQLAARILTIPARVGQGAGPASLGAACTGAAARLLGVVARPALDAALARELAGLDPEAAANSREAALMAYDAFAQEEGAVGEGAAATGSDAPPDWIELPLDPVTLAAPDIHGAATSVAVRTGLWRTMRPELDPERCNRCTWICGSLCPDGVITADAEGFPEIDFDHCKGCLVCVAVCPRHALLAVPERRAAKAGDPASDSAEARS
jgi:pyruvate ferredoxin oxidoreductase gamma subunit